MTLWQPGEFRGEQIIVEKDGLPGILVRGLDRQITQKIADEHNAWIIFHQRHFTLARVHDLYFIQRVEMAFKDGLKESPVAAILAADAFLKERGK